MSSTDTSIDTSALDALLGGAVERGAFPGVAAVVSTRDGVAYEFGAGKLHAGDPASGAVDTKTMFRMASMTKAMASVAALQLIEDGRLSLDTPVQDHLPEFADLEVLTGFDGDEPITRAPSRPPVIQDLLTHTSGCGYFFSNEKLLQWHGVTGRPHVLGGERAGVFTPLVHDPGTMWEYGVSTDALGLVVDAVTGSTLAAVLEERVFGPLGMTDTTFAPDAGQRERLMGIHARQEDGSLAPSPIDLSPAPEYMAGGHGSYATAADHGRFLRALLRGGELDGARILRPETVDLMFTDFIADIEQPAAGIVSAAPELSNDVPALPIKTGWGLGLSLRHERIPGFRAAGSGDWAGLFNCYYWIDRDTGISAALLTQVLPFFDQQIIETLLGFELALYAGLG